MASQINEFASKSQNNVSHTCAIYESQSNVSTETRDEILSHHLASVDNSTYPSSNAFRKRSLASPSFEQKKIINSLLNGKSVIVDAVAGSGKTTTILWIAKAFKNKKLLMLTYNRRLRDETREKTNKLFINNLNVFTYHGFVSRYFTNNNDTACKTDVDMVKMLNIDKLKADFGYDLVIIDEAQDMTPLYCKLVSKIINKSTTFPNNMVLLGDCHQSIYDFQGADSRFLSGADKIFNQYTNWDKLTLSESFRITADMALFMNKVVLDDNRIKSSKHLVEKPKYFVCDIFDNNETNVAFVEIKNILQEQSPDTIFILAPSVKSNKSPLRVLAQLVGTLNVPIFVPANDEDKLDDDIIKGKIVFSTYHSTKGLERDNVFVFNFDESYFNYYEKEAPRYKCPNALYVALTRAKNKLFIFHHYRNDYISFISKSRLDKFTNICRHKRVKPSKLFINNKPQSVGATELLKHINTDVLIKAVRYLTIKKIKEPIHQISIPTKIYNNNNTCENVSEITGIAIPAYFEYKDMKEMTIYNEVLQRKGTRVTTNHNDVCLCPESDSDSESVSESNNESNTLLWDGKTNISIPELLYISNEWAAMMSGYSHKLKQITQYNWVTEDNLNKTLERMRDLNLSNKSIFEQEYIISPCSHTMMKELIGYIDIIDENNVYEIKCVESINTEHYIQLGIYMYMIAYSNLLKYNTRSFTLYNVLSGEKYSINAKVKDLDNMIQELFAAKYSTDRKMDTDEIFYNKYRNIS
tara:strand:+ start:9968 stop:12223 length:2256 start_codon:yes stop_codon:yes gene_type:complete